MTCAHTADRQYDAIIKAAGESFDSRSRQLIRDGRTFTMSERWPTR